MAGLVKAKDYDWKDSNLSLFGSDLERNVSLEAIGEPQPIFFCHFQRKGQTIAFFLV